MKMLYLHLKNETLFTLFIFSNKYDNSIYYNFNAVFEEISVQRSPKFEIQQVFVILQLKKE